MYDNVTDRNSVEEISNDSEDLDALWILITITLEMISEEDSKRWKVIKS